MCLLAEMREQRKCPTKELYDSTIRECRKAGRYEKAMAIFNTMGAHGAAPDATSYTEALEARESAESTRS